MSRSLRKTRIGRALARTAATTLNLGQNLERRRQRDFAVFPVTLSNRSLRYSNPVLHGVPFRVIPNQQVPLWAVRALDQAIVVWVYFAIVLNFLKRSGHDSPCGEETGEQDSTPSRPGPLRYGGGQSIESTELAVSTLEELFTWRQRSFVQLSKP
jgi:hypothetical protein